MAHKILFVERRTIGMSLEGVDDGDNWGVWGNSIDGVGVWGSSFYGRGVFGSCDNGWGLHGKGSVGLMAESV